ncbi:MAG: hypothetical protein H6627_06205 [Calditrichae bacterium]|nr:hypothetical protein [Calditrichia bacterium]
MNLIKISIIIFVFALYGFVLADDGLKENFSKVQMNINEDNYIIFEEECLIVCNRETDEYLVEITPENELYIRSRKISLSNEERELVRDYYLAQRTLFSNRNSIGAKGIHIGIESAKLAAKAVGGAIGLVASGFDEKVEAEFEQEMENESRKIEYHAERIEMDADEMEDNIDELNRIEHDLSLKITDLDNINLRIVEEELGNITLD